MIVISVSLVAIGLIVWAIGDNYHYSSDLMAGQEVDSMTPKTGYNIIAFDDSQPVGAKLKLLDHAETNATAFKLKEQYASTIPIIMIFGSSTDDNQKLMAYTKLISAQIAQEKASSAAATEKATQVTKNASPPNPGNESAILAPKLNTTNNTSSPQTGQEQLALAKKVNGTVTPENQTTTNGTHKSVNLDESIGITSK